MNDINKNTISVKLIINNSDLLLHKDFIFDVLQENNIKIQDNSENILFIDLENKNKKIHNTFMANTKIVFKVFDLDGNVIKYNYKNYTSSSDKSFQTSYNKNLVLILENIGDIFNGLLN